MCVCVCVFKCAGLVRVIIVWLKVCVCVLLRALMHVFNVFYVWFNACYCVRPMLGFNVLVSVNVCGIVCFNM